VREPAQAIRLEEPVVRASEMWPNRPAVEDASHSTSYAELVGRADHLARRLVTETDRSVVGLAANSDTDTLVAYLAILMARRVVVPLSMGHLDRARRACAATGLDLIVSTSPTRDDQALLAPLRIRTPQAVAERSAGALGPGQDDPRAYVLFTSGSTGVPKGVIIDHTNVLAYLRYVVPAFELSPETRASATFGLTFDPSVHDLFATWAAGGTVVLPQGREFLLVSSYVSRARLTHWFSVPSTIHLARRMGALEPNSMPDLQWSLFAGEQLRLESARAWARAAPRSVVENLYGPTEMTITCSRYRLPVAVEDWPETPNGTVPIGQIYTHLEQRLVPDGGGPSELLLRGAQRFGGYVDPADNRGSFSPEAPPSEPPGPELWYRTGDQVQEIDGLLVHLGRGDRQVKISGIRTELGDVEATLSAIDGIDAAVVGAFEGEIGSELRGAVMSDSLSERDVVHELRRRGVPAHMVPRRLMILSQFPLTSSGKTDQQSILDLLHDPERMNGVTAPGSPEREAAGGR
jgi:amino acid adenylation domain-containing protein